MRLHHQQISGQAQARDKHQQLGCGCRCSPQGAVPRPFQLSGAAPGHPCAPFACLPRGSGQSPLGVRSEAGTLRVASLCCQSPCGQELSFPPGTRARWERLGSHSAVRVSQPTQERHRPPGLHSSKSALTRAHPGSLL